MIWIIVIVLVAIILLSLLLMNQIGANRVQLMHTDIYDDKISESIDILHISDLHLYKHMSGHRLNNIKKRIIESIKQKIPDLVLLTGDFIDNDSGIALLDEVLKLLKSKHGIYSVLGNHDFRQYNFLHIFYPLFYKVEGLKTDLKALKQTLNVNSVIMLDHDCKDLIICGNKIELLGIDARSFNSPELAQWINIKKEKYKLVLSHYPDAIKHLEKNIDLMLAGHTHGGQLTLFGWPLITKSRLKRKFVSGLSQWQGSQLFVSRGAGVSHYMPFRLFCPAEITRIQLKGR